MQLPDCRILLTGGGGGGGLPAGGKRCARGAPVRGVAR